MPEDHPWQQAIGPFRRLVEMATNPWELVVDPFLGPGTTGLACILTERQFIGSDIDAGAATLSFPRLSAARPDKVPGDPKTLCAGDRLPASMPPCGQR